MYIYVKYWTLIKSFIYIFYIMIKSIVTQHAHIFSNSTYNLYAWICIYKGFWGHADRISDVACAVCIGHIADVVRMHKMLHYLFAIRPLLHKFIPLLNAHPLQQSLLALFRIDN